jgi:hypothetical protein
MKRKKRPPRFKIYLKRWEAKFKKIKSKKDRLIFSALIMGGILAMIFLVFYFKSLIEKERSEVVKEFEKIFLEGRTEDKPILLESPEPTSLETLFRLREAGIERYFLTGVELIGDYYTPTIHTCLFEEGKPIYPLYIYETWSEANYPELKPEISLIRYLLLPEDNLNFQPDKNCFIKEIKTEQDWQELKEKYDFSRSQFQTRPQN